MPQEDRTGPEGKGQMTGRVLGYCKSQDTAGFGNSGFGNCPSGFGRGRGFGMRLGRGSGRFANARPFYQATAEYNAEDEIKNLKAEKEEIEKRIKQLQKE
ncbi:MAG: DUF5320 domain-containing protein [archaeon]|nr:DUF5320 domain-containing protein [archaeon]